QTTATPADQLMVNAAARATNKNKNEPKGKKNTASVDSDRLKVLAIEALRQAEEMTDHTTRGTPAEALELRAIVLMEEEQPLPPGPRYIDVEMRVTAATDRSIHTPTVIETHAMPTKSENNQDQRSTGEHASTLQRTTGSYWLQRAPALSDISPSPKQFQAINNHRKDESEGPQGLAELEEEALIYLDDETGAKAEIEVILAEL
ncbi:hypothetical protein BFJ71_g17589, partial [Fusarium oxysporum]